jgi:putative transcriptional regulator, luxR family
MVALYLLRKLSLISAFATFAVTAQLLEMVRIAFLLFTKPAGYEAMVIYYQVGSYTILLYLALGFIRQVPVLVTALNIATLLFVTLYDNNAIDQQIALLFTLLCIFTCALAYISQQGMDEIHQENKDYQDTHNSILTAFNMNQSELIAYLQICRAKEPNNQHLDMLLNQLNEQSKHNLIHAAMVLKKKHDAQQLELSKCFPSLTHTELEVSRLVVEGKTLGEIALIMGKTTTNISTVRGNVRKKLGLHPNEDLEEKLKELAAPADKALKKLF